MGVAGLLTGVSCGSSKGTSSSSSSGTASAANFNSVTNLPDFAAILGGSSSSGSSIMTHEAVVGTPKAFSKLTKEDMETYFTGSLSTLLATLQSSSSTDAQIRQALGDFFSGQGKCFIAQGAAEQLQHLNEATTSVCYMTKFPTKATIDFVAGTQLSDPKTIFDQQTADRTIKLNIKNAPMMGKSGVIPIEQQSGPEAFYIYFTITGSSTLPNGYKAVMNMCMQNKGTWTNNGSETIELNRSTAVMTLTHVGSDTFSDGSGSFNSVLTSKVNEKSDGTYEWTGDRSMTVKGSFSGSFTFTQPSGQKLSSLWVNGATISFSDTFNGSMDVSFSGSNTIVTSKFFHANSNTVDGQTFSGTDKGYSKVVGTGTTFDDFAILMGAGKHSFTHSGQFSQSNQGALAFEYNENKSPRYVTTDASFTAQTVTASELFTEVNAVDFAKDALLGNSSPTAPSTKELSFNCASPPTPTMEYNFDMSQSGAQAVVKACGSHFSGGRQMCDNLTGLQQQVFQKQKDKGGPDKDFKPKDAI
jgi:hypothetical protein